jgi:hypothetical protein
MHKVLCLLNLVQALADPYFRGLAKLECEPSAQPISKLDFEFEGRKLTKEDVREMIYREILEYHPQMLQEYIEGEEQIHFLYPRCRFVLLISHILFSFRIHLL